VVSAVLLGAINALFERAVSEGRVFPFTGEADEQRIDPGLVLIWSVLATLVTFVVVARIAAQRRRADASRRWPVVAAIVLVLLFAGPVAFLAKEIATNKVSQQLYAAWYVPFLAAGTLAYAVFLLAGSSTARRR
jgi:dolichyl-phosphate-mannose--protein O-mannosyl transferase